MFFDGRISLVVVKLSQLFITNNSLRIFRFVFTFVWDVWGLNLLPTQFQPVDLLEKSVLFDIFDAVGKISISF